MRAAILGCLCVSTAWADPPTTVSGAGRIREAAIIEVDQQPVLAITTARGTQQHPIELEFTDTFELIRIDLRDLIGDSEFEIWLDYSTTHDPCGACDDGPKTWRKFVIVCKVNAAGRSQCSDAIRYSYGEDVTPSELDTTLAIQRNGQVRFSNVRAKNRSKRDVAAASRSTWLRFR